MAALWDTLRSFLPSGTDRSQPDPPSQYAMAQGISMEDYLQGNQFDEPEEQAPPPPVAKIQPAPKQPKPTYGMTIDDYIKDFEQQEREKEKENQYTLTNLKRGLSVLGKKTQRQTEAFERGLSTISDVGRDVGRDMYTGARIMQEAIGRSLIKPLARTSVNSIEGAVNFLGAKTDQYLKENKWPTIAPAVRAAVEGTNKWADNIRYNTQPSKRLQALEASGAGGLETVLDPAWISERGSEAIWQMLTQVATYTLGGPVTAAGQMYTQRFADYDETVKRNKKQYPNMDDATARREARKEINFLSAWEGAAEYASLGLFFNYPGLGRTVAGHVAKRAGYIAEQAAAGYGQGAISAITSSVAKHYYEQDPEPWRDLWKRLIIEGTQEALPGAGGAIAVSTQGLTSAPHDIKAGQLDKAATEVMSSLSKGNLTRLQTFSDLQNPSKMDAERAGITTKMGSQARQALARWTAKLLNGTLQRDADAVGYFHQIGNIATAYQQRAAQIEGDPKKERERNIILEQNVREAAELRGVTPNDTQQLEWLRQAETINRNAGNYDDAHINRAFADVIVYARELARQKVEALSAKISETIRQKPIIAQEAAAKTKAIRDIELATAPPTPPETPITLVPTRIAIDQPHVGPLTPYFPSARPYRAVETIAPEAPIDTTLIDQPNEGPPRPHLPPETLATEIDIVPTETTQDQYTTDQIMEFMNSLPPEQAADLYANAQSQDPEIARQAGDEILRLMEEAGIVPAALPPTVEPAPSGAESIPPTIPPTVEPTTLEPTQVTPTPETEPGPPQPTPRFYAPRTEEEISQYVKQTETPGEAIEEGTQEAEDIIERMRKEELAKQAAKQARRAQKGPIIPDPTLPESLDPAFDPEGKLDLPSDFTTDESGVWDILGPFVRIGKAMFTKPGEGTPFSRWVSKWWSREGNVPKEAYQGFWKLKDESSAILQRAADVVADIKVAAKGAGWGKKLTSDQRRLINAVFAKEKGVSLQDLPVTLQAPVQDMRNLITSLSREMKKLGMVEGDLAVIVDENMEFYSHRSFAAYDDPLHRHRIPDAAIQSLYNWIANAYPHMSSNQVYQHLEEYLYVGKAGDRPRGTSGADRAGIIKVADTLRHRLQAPRKIIEMHEEIETKGQLGSDALDRVSELVYRTNPNATPETMLEILTALEHASRITPDVSAAINHMYKNTTGEAKRIVKGWADLPKAFRVAYGEHKDFEINFLRTASLMAKDIAQFKFEKMLAEVGLGTFLWHPNDPNIPREANDPIGATKKITKPPKKAKGLKTFDVEEGTITRKEVEEEEGLTFDEGEIDIEQELKKLPGRPESPLLHLRTYPHIAEALTELVNGTARYNEHGLINAFRILTAQSKLAVTVQSIAGMVRNLYGGMGITMASGILNPIDAARKMSAAAGAASSLRQLRMATLPGTTIPFRTEADFKAGRRLGLRALEVGALNPSGEIGELTEALAKIRPFKSKTLAAIAAKYPETIQKLRTTSNVAKSAFTYGDEVNQILIWLREIDNIKKIQPGISQADSEVEAAKISSKIYPTWRAQSRAVRSLRANPIFLPFAFPYEMVRVTKDIVLQASNEIASGNPEARTIGAKRLVGLSLAALGPEIMASLSKLIAGISDDEEEDRRTLAKSYDANSTLLQGPLQADGTFTYFSMGSVSPFNFAAEIGRAFIRGETAVEGITGAAEEIRQTFLGPEMLAKAGFEAISGESDWGPVWQEQDPLIAKLGKGVRHAGRTLFPGTLKTANKLLKDPVKETGALTSGGRKVTIEPIKETERAARRYNKSLQDSNYLIGQYFNKPVDKLPFSGVLQTEYDNSMAARKDTQRDMTKILNAANRLTKNPAKVKAAAIEMGIPAKDYDSILVGRYIHHVPSDIIDVRFLMQWATPEHKQILQIALEDKATTIMNSAFQAPTPANKKDITKAQQTLSELTLPPEQLRDMALKSWARSDSEKLNKKREVKNLAPLPPRDRPILTTARRRVLYQLTKTPSPLATVGTTP